MTDRDPQGLTWDQCLSVAYQGCAEVLAQRVQELERERDEALAACARWQETGARLADQLQERADAREAAVDREAAAARRWAARWREAARRFRRERNCARGQATDLAAALDTWAEEAEGYLDADNMLAMTLCDDTESRDVARDTLAEWGPQPAPCTCDPWAQEGDRCARCLRMEETP